MKDSLFGQHLTGFLETCQVLAAPNLTSTLRFPCSTSLTPLCPYAIFPMCLPKTWLRLIKPLFWVEQVSPTRQVLNRR